MFDNNLTGFQVLKNFVAEVKVKLMRDHLRLLSQRLPLDLQKLLFILTAPQNLELNVKLDAEKASGPKGQAILETPLGFIKELIKMVPLELVFGSDADTIRKIQEIQIALSSFYFFTNVKLHVEGLFE